MDQKEALIAIVRAQVEKEKAEKAEKLKREHEAMKLSGKKVEKEATTSDKPKFKTLSAEELAKIEERKKRKKAEELGIDYDEFEKQISQEVNAVLKKEGLDGVAKKAKAKPEDDSSDKAANETSKNEAPKKEASKNETKRLKTRLLKVD